jgi:hypothetical protein
MSDALQEASEALDASEERLRDLFDEAPMLMSTRASIHDLFAPIARQ